MLSRRSLRIKVMQVLFAYEMGSSVKMDALYALLDRYIQSFINLYLVNLMYIQRVAEYVNDYSDRLGAKLLLSEDQKKVSTRIHSNTIVDFIRTNPDLQAEFKFRKIKNYIDDQTVKKLFEAWIKKDEYKRYISLDEPSLDDEKKVLTHLLKKIMHDNDDYLQFLEEHFINLHDDNHQVNFQAQKAIDKFKPGKSNYLFGSVDDTDEGIVFSKELVNSWVKHHDTFDERIQPKLKNWDVERVALMDMILIKMAMCEMLYFKTIPVKVTINEYVDIAKYYSTPKSKDFVNGIIDKLMHEMKAKGEIKKEGRGLIDF